MAFSELDQSYLTDICIVYIDLQETSFLEWDFDSWILGEI